MLKSIGLAIATFALSSAALAADVTSTAGSPLTCAQPLTAGRTSACETAATLAPVGWTRKTPQLMNMDASGGGSLVFTDGSSLTPWTSLTANPAGYYNIVAMFAIIISSNQSVIIHSTDGVNVDGMAFASRGY